MEVEETISNPWCVDNVSVFLKFCCPECDYQIPDIQMFFDHAAENHIKSRALFGDENTNVPQQLQQLTMDNDCVNEDFNFNLDEAEAEAEAEVEAVAPTRPTELTSAQKDRAEKNRIKAIALKKAKLAQNTPTVIF